MAKSVALHYSWILVCFIEQRKPQKDTDFFEVYIKYIIGNDIYMSESIATSIYG